ncbi:protein PHYTOCHROME-DEPENDENT LATE-FLOWERING-like [Malus domestica]|uniref:protein PHYTOCHROME-DEPENDENT LATE-FLOWERING-like n=1 Tax=Malus domestica TaxID=3750 RepID=UPI00397507AB
MGVSFQVAKTGTRYRPKLLPTEEKDSSENDSGSDPQQRENEVNCTGMGAKVAAADPSSVLVNLSEDFEVSFSLKLFENGFNVGKANELLNGVPEHLHPYDRASEKLFTIKSSEYCSTLKRFVNILMQDAGSLLRLSVVGYLEMFLMPYLANMSMEPSFVR